MSVSWKKFKKKVKRKLPKPIRKPATKFVRGTRKKIKKFTTKIKNLIKTINKPIKSTWKKLKYKIYMMYIKFLKVNKSVIIFESNSGRNYTGNPKYIYEEFVRQGLDKIYKCYYIFNDPDSDNDLIGNAEKIKRYTLKYYKIMATAGFWVCDCRLPLTIIKRPECTYIQTWHGTPLKKLGLDMDDVSMAGSTDIETYKKNFYDNAQTWDYLISQNHFSSEIFRRCFAFSKDMLEIGYPRNDTLMKNNNEEFITELKKKFKLPLDKKILIYAPTWRDNQYYSKGKYKFAVDFDFDLAKRELSDEYVLIVKYHYLIKDKINWKKYKGFVYKFDATYDIAELYLVSDMLITDYSSVMFDYSILKRPMFFYTFDLEEYKDNLRGFYFDFLEEAPGPISLTTEQLIKDIKSYSPEKYAEKYEKYHNKFNHVDDGKSAEKVVKLINEKSGISLN